MKLSGQIRPVHNLHTLTSPFLITRIHWVFLACSSQLNSQFKLHPSACRKAIGCTCMGSLALIITKYVCCLQRCSWGHTQTCFTSLFVYWHPIYLHLHLASQGLSALGFWGVCFVSYLQLLCNVLLHCFTIVDFHSNDDYIQWNRSNFLCIFC